MQTDGNSRFTRQNRNISNNEYNIDTNFNATPSLKSPSFKSPKYGNQTSNQNFSKKRITISENMFDDAKKRKSFSQLKIQNQSENDVFLYVQAVIENAECQQSDNISLQYNIQYGNFWKLKCGNITGQTQSASSNNIYSKHVTLNFPVELVFRTKSLTGWPQFLVKVYGTDYFGKQVLQGYGFTHIPCENGIHQKKIYLYKPLPISWITGIIGYFSNKMPQFINYEKSVATGYGREVIRTESYGFVNIKFNIELQNMQKFGFQAQ